MTVKEPALMADVTEGPFTRREGVDYREVPDGAVAYAKERERVHYLNPTAAIVYLLCDGRHDASTIAAEVARQFGLKNEPLQDVRDCLAQLQSEGLIAVAGDGHHLV
jgi:hypothetical protein